jgi:hypothetical protein
MYERNYTPAPREVSESSARGSEMCTLRLTTRFPRAQLLSTHNHVTHSRTPAITQVRPPCAQAQWCENPRAGLEARRRTCLAHGHSAGQSPSKPAPFLLTIVPLVAEEHRHSEAGHAFLRQVHLPAPTTRHQRQRGNRSSADPRYPVIILIPCRARALSLPLPVSLPLSISQSLARARARVRVLRARGYAHVRARSLSTLQYNGNCIA